jgi:homoserine dehydrogenase
VVILSNILMGTELSMADIDRVGITKLTPEDIRNAKIDDRRWKLIGTVEKDGDKVTASVQPIPLPMSHPLATVMGATNAVTFSTDLLGDVTLAGPGAGRKETGYALIADLIAIYSK